MQVLILHHGPCGPDGTPEDMGEKEHEIDGRSQLSNQLVIMKENLRLQ